MADYSYGQLETLWINAGGSKALAPLMAAIALFGVMAINITTEFRVSIFEQFLARKHPASPFDRIVETILMLAVDLKAFALFSLLFGIGLAIQFERLSASPRRISSCLSCTRLPRPSASATCSAGCGC